MQAYVCETKYFAGFAGWGDEWEWKCVFSYVMKLGVITTHLCHDCDHNMCDKAVCKSVGYE